MLWILICTILMEFTASSAHSSTDNDPTILAQECLSIIIVAIVLPYEHGCKTGPLCVCVSVTWCSFCWCVLLSCSSYSCSYRAEDCGGCTVRLLLTNVEMSVFSIHFTCRVKSLLYHFWLTDPRYIIVEQNPALSQVRVKKAGMNVSTH